MSQHTADGGPAFAAITTSPSDDVYHQTGMSLRDWFAGQALQGLLSSNALYGGKSDARNLLAADAYAHADAMLAARAKSGSDQL